MEREALVPGAPARPFPEVDDPVERNVSPGLLEGLLIQPRITEEIADVDAPAGRDAHNSPSGKVCDRRNGHQNTSQAGD
jgi:hypothetical protein